MYTTNQIGDITEAEVALYLMKLGFTISKPINSGSRYDFILDTGTKLLKLQVKTASKVPKSKNITSNIIKFNCKSVSAKRHTNKQTRYSAEEIDYFATFWDGKCYLVPVNECSVEKRLHLSNINLKNNQCYAENYLAEEVLKA